MNELKFEGGIQVIHGNLIWIDEKSPIGIAKTGAGDDVQGVVKIAGEWFPVEDPRAERRIFMQAYEYQRQLRADLDAVRVQVYQEKFDLLQELKKANATIEQLRAEMEELRATQASIPDVPEGAVWVPVMGYELDATGVSDFENDVETGVVLGVFAHGRKRTDILHHRPVGYRMNGDVIEIALFKGDAS